MHILNFVKSIVALHHDRIVDWKQEGMQHREAPDRLQHEGFLNLVEKNHTYNFLLWHAEDKARRDDMGYEFVYQAKRKIDHFNQQRNNAMEFMDEWLYKEFLPADPANCPVHSETPGMMIDRLSILALKRYHMALQTKRIEVDAAHREQCLSKLQVIDQQKIQLQVCLQQLLSETQQQIRTFRVYHQFKMYNDPTLNPELNAEKV